jgi:hypothetical protein
VEFVEELPSQYRKWGGGSTKGFPHPAALTGEALGEISNQTALPVAGLVIRREPRIRPLSEMVCCRIDSASCRNEPTSCISTLWTKAGPHLALEPMDGADAKAHVPPCHLAKWADPHKRGTGTQRRLGSDPTLHNLHDRILGKPEIPPDQAFLVQPEHLADLLVAGPLASPW